MSAWKRRLLKGGLVVGASLLALGGSAFAAGTRILGGGSSLQTIVQSTWLANWPTQAASLPGATGTYQTSNSGAALSNWGLTSSISALGSPLWAYIATDLPPTRTQIANSATIAGTTPITVPVTQSPIAIVIGLPRGVSVTSGPLRVTNTMLSDLFAGRIQLVGPYPGNSWGALLTTAGATFTGGATELTSRIKLEVRNTTSGTTFGIKNYLSKINPSWSNDGTVVWPAASNVEFTRCGVGNNGNAQLAATVAAAAEGSIGYVDLADTVAAGFSSSWTTIRGTLADCVTTASHDVAYALVQNNGISGSPTFADPINAGRANVRTIGDWTDVNGNVPRSGYPSPGGSWFDAGVTANNPSAGAQGIVQRYGIVGSSFVVVWDDYVTAPLQSAYGTTSHDIEDTACSFVRYLVGTSPYTLLTSGQVNLNPYYAPLPASVLAAAQVSAASCG
jgi:hypothetical protein